MFPIGVRLIDKALEGYIKVSLTTKWLVCSLGECFVTRPKILSQAHGHVASAKARLKAISLSSFVKQLVLVSLSVFATVVLYLQLWYSHKSLC